MGLYDNGYDCGTPITNPNPQMNADDNFVEQGWGVNNPNISFDTELLFDRQSDSYESEREVYRVMQTEMFSKFGTPFLWYITSFNKNYDQQFGEDSNRVVERAFEIMAMITDLPENHMTYNFQLSSVDSFKFYISIEHFKWQSALDLPKPSDLSGQKITNYSINHLTQDLGTGSVGWSEEFLNSEFSSEFEIGTPFRSYIPKVGDIVKMKFNNYLYSVVDVHEEDVMFHQHKHTWTILVNKFTNNHDSISTDINEPSIVTTINSVVDENDVSDIVDELKVGDHLVQHTPTETPIRDDNWKRVLFQPDANEVNPNEDGEGW